MTVKEAHKDLRRAFVSVSWVEISRETHCVAIGTEFHFISFQIFKEGGPSASADFQGALRLHYNIILIKKKKTLITKA